MHEATITVTVVFVAFVVFYVFGGAKIRRGGVPLRLVVSKAIFSWTVFDCFKCGIFLFSY